MKNWLVTVRTDSAKHYFTVAALTRNGAANTARRLGQLLQGKDPRTYNDIILNVEEI